MRLLPIILITIISLSGCASNSNQNKEKPLPIPYKLPAPTIEVGDTSIIGVALHKSFGGFSECPIERDIIDKNKFQYEIFPKDTCYKKLNGKFGNVEPLGRETIYISWRATNESIPFYLQGLKVEVIDGIVHGIEASTRGIDYQDQITKDLVSKFGNPKTSDIYKSQNKMGAKFDVRHLTWTKQNLSISFIGALTNIKTGYILLSTDKMTNIKKLEDESKEAVRPKL